MRQIAQRTQVRKNTCAIWINGVPRLHSVQAYAKIPVQPGVIPPPPNKNINTKNVVSICVRQNRYSERINNKNNKKSIEKSHFFLNTQLEYIKDAIKKFYTITNQMITRSKKIF